MKQDEKKLLLELARKSIKKEEINVDDIPESLKEKKAVFVTLTIDNQLRGCIGHIFASAPLYQAVIDCAHSSAYSDPRFPPVSEEEINKLKIEISILTNPEKLEYKDKDDLLNKLTHEHGVIIKKGMHSSTFLPSVWEQLPKKEDFLGHLCMKAGLAADEWESGSLEVETYKVEKFEE